MTALDIAILAVLFLSVVGGLQRGFIVAVVSLIGFAVAIFVAGRYWFVAMPLMRPLLERIWLAELASFFLVAFVTIVVFTLVARLLRRTAEMVGLGWLDRLLGGALGLLRGVLVVVLGFIIIAAFLPGVTWTRNSRYAPVFLSAAQTVTHNVPSAAADKVLEGLHRLRVQCKDSGNENVEQF